MTLQQNSTQTSQPFLTEPRFGSTISLEYLEKLITFDIQMIVKFLTNGGIKSLSHLVLQKVQSSDYSNLLKILNLLLKLSNNDPNPLYSSKISLLINEIDKVIHTSDFLTFYPDLQKRLSIDNLIAQLQKKFNELVRKRGFEDSLELQIFEQNFPQKTNTLKKLRVNDKIPQNGKENQISPKILTNKELQEKLLLANQNKGYNKTIGISNENKQIEPERKIRKVRKNVKYKPKNKLVIVEFFENKKEESLDLKLKLQNVLWSQPLSLKTTEGQSLKIKRESKEKMIQEYRQDGCIREIFIFGNKPPFTPEEAKEDSDPNFKFDSSTFFSQFGKNKEKDQIKNNSEFNETKDRDTKEGKVLEQGEIDDDEKEEQQLLNEMKEMNENQVYGENEQNEEKQEEKILIISWEKNDILSNERLIDSVLENPQLYSTLMNVFSKQENGLQNDPQKTNYIPPIQNNMNMNMNMNGNNNFPYSPNNNFQPQPLQYPQQYQQPPQQFQQPPQQFQQQPQQFQQQPQQFQQPPQQFQQPPQQFQQPQQQFQQQPQQYQMQPFNQQNPQSFNQMPPPQMNNMQMQQPPPQQYQQPPPQQQPMYPPQMNNFNGMNNQQNVGYYDQYNTFQNSYPSNNFYPPQNIIQPQYPPPQQY
ncbi:eukaryotic translation initiation factor 4e transporter [Anaeramoeba flamelloides]|uniref:Eukaryotic translation initiation factor 4e transporter n=1 Tax=Anaeramoeba flamelloides TaxID=1746091 RepID=A0ABQ8XRK9_9EUKA|nr:eukaryotic translation initiation factor 4e transporter [Anaeramoeba flamelloides]